jgi:hypothetical protein
MSVSIDMAKKSGDTKYLKVCETFKRLKSGEIDECQAIEILGEKYKNTVIMWRNSL